MTPHPPPKMTQGGNEPPNPPPSPSTASLSGVARCWHSSAYFSLFSSLFFFDPPNRFVQIPRDLSWFRSCWLCYFRYSTNTRRGNFVLPHAHDDDPAIRALGRPTPLRIFA